MDKIESGQDDLVKETPSDTTPITYYQDEAAFMRGEVSHVVHADTAALAADLDSGLKPQYARGETPHVIHVDEFAYYGPESQTSVHSKEVSVGYVTETTELSAAEQVYLHDALAGHAGGKRFKPQKRSAARMRELRGKPVHHIVEDTVETEPNYAPLPLAVFISEQVWALSNPKTVKKKPTATELSGAEKFMAEAIMRSPLIWEVLKQQYTEGLERIQSTRDVVMPIYELESTLRERLLDSESFFRSFNGLTRDIAAWSDRLNAAHNTHAVRTGDVSEEDVALVTPLSQLYTEMHHEFDVTIKGGLAALVEIMRAQTPDLVEA